MSHAKHRVKRVLVTGGAGFIGSHIVDALMARKGVERVVVIDNFDTNYDPKLKVENTKIHKKDARYRLVKGDIRDLTRLKALFKKEQFDTVIHLAAKADARKAVDTPREYLEVNVMGSYNILECAREYGVTQLVLASTSAVYGNKNKAPFKESAQTDFALTAYGASKKAMEQLAYTYHHNHGQNIVCIRIFNAYGERMRPDLVLPTWVRAILSDQPIRLSGKGVRKRDYTYVGDLVSAFMSALTVNGFDVINVGSSKPITLNALLKTVEKTLGTTAAVIEVPSHHGSVEQTHANTQHAEYVLRWKPTTSLEEGVRRYVRWIKSRLK